MSSVIPFKKYPRYIANVDALLTLATNLTEVAKCVNQQGNPICARVLLHAVEFITIAARMLSKKGGNHDDAA